MKKIAFVMFILLILLGGLYIYSNEDTFFESLPVFLSLVTAIILLFPKSFPAFWRKIIVKWMFLRNKNVDVTLTTVLDSSSEQYEANKERLIKYFKNDTKYEKYIDSIPNNLKVEFEDFLFEINFSEENKIYITNRKMKRGLQSLKADLKTLHNYYTDIEKVLVDVECVYSAVFRFSGKNPYVLINIDDNPITIMIKTDSCEVTEKHLKVFNNKLNDFYSIIEKKLLIK